MNVREDEITRAIEQFGRLCHGSDFSLAGMRENKVLVRIRGPCVACPASFISLERELERTLKGRFPEVEKVEIIL